MYICVMCELHCYVVEWWHHKQKQMEAESLVDQSIAQAWAPVPVLTQVPLCYSGISYFCLPISGHPRFLTSVYISLLLQRAGQRNRKHGEERGPWKCTIFYFLPLKDLGKRKKIILFPHVPRAVMSLYFSLQVTYEKQFSPATLKCEELYQIKNYVCVFWKGPCSISQGISLDLGGNLHLLTLEWPWISLWNDLGLVTSPIWSHLSKRITPATSPCQLGLGQRIKSFTSRKTLCF